MKVIADYSYSVWNNKMTIYIKDLSGNEFSVAEIDDVNELTDDTFKECLALETIEDLGYITKDNFNSSNIKLDTSV